ncbi:DeoR/GlpR transcriptional regulator [Alicyclobacillus curvatus]|nr:DeoR/GlpR transcriptional regulator [Alicyclobacillus curvatus]
MRRHQEIIELLRTTGVVSVSELAERYECSPSTIRRDIGILSRTVDELRRLHGAVAMKPEMLEQNFQEKLTQAYQQKVDIAAAVVEHLPESGVIGLNGGTTTTLVARQLAKTKRNLTVVTNAVNISFELTGSSVSVVVIGGALRPSNYETTGRMAEENLRGLHLDVAVLGANGLDPRFGASTSAELEAAVGRTFADQADEVIIVADSTKLGERALFQMVDWSSIRYVATDAGANDLLLQWGGRRNTPEDLPATVWEVQTRG